MCVPTIYIYTCASVALCWMHGSLLLSLFGIFVYNRQHENGRLEILAFEALFLWTQKNIKATIFLRFWKIGRLFPNSNPEWFWDPVQPDIFNAWNLISSFDLKLANLKVSNPKKHMTNWLIPWLLCDRKDFKREPKHLYVLIYISFCHRIHIWILFLLMFLASSFYQKNPANPQHMTSRTSYDHLRPTSANLASSHI